MCEEVQHQELLALKTLTKIYSRVERRAPSQKVILLACVLRCARVGQQSLEAEDNNTTSDSIGAAI